MGPNNSIFVSILADRIEHLRDDFEIDPDFQIKGMRFYNTAYAVESIEGAILVRKNPQMRGLVVQEAMGLEFDENQILDGAFDPLIRIMLKHLASMDYEGEHRVDFN